MAPQKSQFWARLFRQRRKEAVERSSVLDRALTRAVVDCDRKYSDAEAAAAASTAEENRTSAFKAS